MGTPTRAPAELQKFAEAVAEAMGVSARELVRKKPEGEA